MLTLANAKHKLEIPPLVVLWMEILIQSNLGIGAAGTVGTLFGGAAATAATTSRLLCTTPFCRSP